MLTHTTRPAAEMIATTDYTVFPVVYVDGVYQHGSTWTQLTRTLCNIAADLGVNVDACAPTAIGLAITFESQVRRRSQYLRHHS